MSSKQTVLNLVKKTGSSIDLDNDYIGVMAPRGKVFEPGIHYDGYGTGSFGDYTKAEIWSNLADGLRHLQDCEEQGCQDCCVTFVPVVKLVS
jgi:hypothetical protein